MSAHRERVSGLPSGLAPGVVSESVTISSRTCKRAIVRSSIETDFKFALPTVNLPTTRRPMANAPSANAPTARAPKALAPIAALPIVNCRRFLECVMEITYPILPRSHRPVIAAAEEDTNVNSVEGKIPRISVPAAAAQMVRRRVGARGSRCSVASPGSCM
jgi:hypothetical protein